MTLVDFAGFRLVCVSLLPISDCTLAYGSADAGASFRHCDLFLAEKIDQACRLLNLKPHRAIGGASSIASPCDLEGHVGLDGSHVVLDFGRLFPPHAVLERPHPLLGKQVFYRFFRPEFVRRHPQPLCADAYSGWLASDPDAAVHNAEVLAATKQLLAEALPAQAAALDAQAQQQQQQQQRQQQQQHNMPQGAVLVAALHAEGINLRHLGLLAGLVSRPAAKTAVLQELVARGLKNVLNGLLRQPQVVSLTHRHHALLAFLNSFFNPRSALWTADLPQELQLHFGLDVSALSLPGFSPPPELFYGAPLFHFLPLSALCARLCALINLRFSPRYLRLVEITSAHLARWLSDIALVRAPVRFPQVLLTDIDSWAPILRQPSFAAFCEAKAIVASLTLPEVSWDDASASLSRGVELASIAERALPSSVPVRTLKAVFAFMLARLQILEKRVGRDEDHPCDNPSAEEECREMEKVVQQMHQLFPPLPDAAQDQAPPPPAVQHHDAQDTTKAHRSVALAFLLGEAYQLLSRFKSSAQYFRYALLHADEQEKRRFVDTADALLSFHRSTGRNPYYLTLGSLRYLVFASLFPTDARYCPGLLSILLSGGSLPYQIANVVDCLQPDSMAQSAEILALLLKESPELTLDQFLSPSNLSIQWVTPITVAQVIMLCQRNESLRERFMPQILAKFTGPKLEMSAFYHNTFPHPQREVALLLSLIHI